MKYYLRIATTDRGIMSYLIKPSRYHSGLAVDCAKFAMQAGLFEPAVICETRTDIVYLAAQIVWFDVSQEAIDSELYGAT